MGQVHKDNLKRLTGVRDTLAKDQKDILMVRDLKSAGSIGITPDLVDGGVSLDFLGSVSGIAGPGGGSTDNAIARWNGTSGGTLQDSPVLIDNAGLISGGAWAGSGIAVGFGGTGRSSTTLGALLVGAGGAAALTELTPGSNGEVLTLAGGVPTWAASAGGGTLGGDVSGPIATTTVSGIQNRPIAATAPTPGQALVWDGSEWGPSAVAGASISGLGGEFEAKIPAGASLAAKVAAATDLPVGWSVVLGDDGSVDAELAATSSDIVFIHPQGAYALDLTIVELDTSASPLTGYYLINTSSVGLLTKSNSTGTQFSVLGFGGLITTSREQTVYSKLVQIP